MRHLLTIALIASLVSCVQIFKECQKEGNIAFTFDQGPSQYTGILLTTLSKANVKATFHVVPDYLDNPVVSANLRRAASDGHLIGLFVKDSITESNIKPYLANASAIMKQYINYQPQFLRFPVPGPSEAILKTVTGLGYKVTSYNLDSMDYNFINDATEPNGEGSIYRAVRFVLDQIIPPTLGSFICVQRDIIQSSVLQTSAILNYTKARGYKAVRLDSCLGIGADIPSVGGDSKDTTGSAKDGYSGSGVSGQRKNNASNSDPNIGYIMAILLVIVMIC